MNKFINYYFLIRNTEERAQTAETQVADLELKLKEALEKVRALERIKNNTINNAK